MGVCFCPLPATSGKRATCSGNLGTRFSMPFNIIGSWYPSLAVRFIASTGREALHPCHWTPGFSKWAAGNPFQLQRSSYYTIECKKAFSWHGVYLYI